MAKRKIEEESLDIAEELTDFGSKLESAQDEIKKDGYEIMLVTKCAHINVRTEPRQSSKVLACLPAVGTTFTGKKYDENWFRVTSVNGKHTTGYVMLNFLIEK